MAERFPRYNRRPLQLPDVPSVDYVTAGRARMQAATSIVSSLDKMAEFAFEAEAEKAFEFGVENAPTSEQIKDARKTGADLGLPRGEFAQAGAYAVVNNRMQTAVLEELVKLDSNPDTINMTPQEYSPKANAIINGYGAVVDQSVNKQAGQKFRAKMFSLGNQRLTAHAKRQMDLMEERDRSRDYATANTVMELMPEIVESGGMISPIDGTVTSAVDIIDQQIETIRELPNLTATEVDGLVNKAIERKQQVVGQYISDWVASKPDAHIAQMMSGNVEDPSVGLLLKDMDRSERAAVMSAAFDQVEEEEAALKGLSDAAERRKKERADATSALAVRAYIDNDTEAMETQLSLLDGIDLDAANELRETFSKEGGIDSPQTINELEVLAASGQITLNDVLTRRSSMSNSTFKSYMGKVEARRQDDHNIALDMFRAHFGISKNAFMPDPDKAGKIARAESELNLAGKKDPTIDRIAFARNYIDNLNRGAEEQERSQARTQLDAAKKINGYEDKTDTEYMNWVLTQQGVKPAQWYSQQTGYLKTLGLMND